MYKKYLGQCLFCFLTSGRLELYIVLLIKESLSPPFTPLVLTYRDENLEIFCRNRKRCDGTLVALASSACSAAWENYTFYIGNFEKYNFRREFAVITQCLHCIMNGCVLITAKVLLGTIGTEPERKEPRYRHLKRGIWLIICWITTLLFPDVSSSNAKLFNCEGKHSSSQYKECSNVFWKKDKV